MQQFNNNYNCHPHNMLFKQTSVLFSLRTFEERSSKSDQKFQRKRGWDLFFGLFWCTLKSMAKIVAVWWDVFLDAVWSSKVLVHVLMFALENLCAPPDAHNMVVYCFCILCGEKKILQPTMGLETCKMQQLASTYTDKTLSTRNQKFPIVTL